MAKAKNKDTSPVATKGFDEVLVELKETVGQLESGKLSLDDSLAAYEKGVGLARKGHELLDSAEKRVELLVQPPTDNEDELSEPFGDDD